jgi:hypothetical protein
MSRERMHSENCSAACSPGLDDLKPGDVIRVRPAYEISATLDAAGTMDGLPFMPEMAALCGREFKVACCINKTCVEGGGGLRIFRHNDVVLLENARCDGRAHGDCQKACLIFWKRAWLEPLGKNDLESKRVANKVDRDLPLQTRSPNGGYFCQSTELIRATSALSAMARLRVCLGDLLNGSYRMSCFVKAIIRALDYKLRQILASRRIGNKRTPAEPLDIQPGEVVQVKSLKEISQPWTVTGQTKGWGLRDTCCRSAAGNTVSNPVLTASFSKTPGRCFR